MEEMGVVPFVQVFPKKRNKTSKVQNPKMGWKSKTRKLKWMHFLQIS
jgi:hypothetical protein